MFKKRKKNRKFILIYDNRKNAWEKQKNETTGKYLQFCYFRDFGPDRTLTKVFTQNKKQQENSEEVTQPTRKMATYNTAHRLCYEFDWVSRADKYDQYIEKERRKEKEKKIIKFFEKKERIGNFMSQFGAAVMVEFDKKRKEMLENDVFKAEELNAITHLDAQRYIKHGLIIEKEGLCIDSQPGNNDKSEQEKPETIILPEDDKLALAQMINKAKKIT